jgi:hypothetical protein
MGEERRREKGEGSRDSFSYSYSFMFWGVLRGWTGKPGWRGGWRMSRSRIRRMKKRGGRLGGL